MKRTKQAQRLHDYIMTGLLGDVVQAREAYAILRMMGKNSDEIVASTYGPFFAALDRSMLSTYLLSIARLFDPPSKKYEIKSIPSALRYIAANKESLPIQQRVPLVTRLTNAGCPPSDLRYLDDAALLDYVERHFRQRMPSTAKSATDSMSIALKAVRARRNKRLAHSEHTEEELFPTLTWADAETLVRFAEEVLDCVAFGLLSLALASDDGYFMLGGDAQRASLAMRRLLVAADIISQPAP